jgi:hypothetical protein
MITYSVYKDKTGMVRYRVTDDTKRPKTKLISVGNIPLLELPRLNQELTKMNLLDGSLEIIDEAGGTQGQSNQQALPESEDCIFGDGLYGNRRKFVEMQKVRLCEEHWQTKTTGEVVAQVRALKEPQVA